MWKIKKSEETSLLFRDAQTFLKYLEQFKDQPVVVTYTNTVEINDPTEQ
jgi:hypothetical protein